MSPRNRFLLTLVAALGLAACAPGPARRVISSPNAPAAIGPYSQAIQVGEMLYVSGQLGVDPKSGQLVPGGVEAETRQALTNLKTVLEAAGFSLRDVAQCQVFVADIGDYAAINAIYATFFDRDPPARALIQAAALPRGGRIEVLAVAVRGR